LLQPSDPTFVSSDSSTGKHKFRWTSKLGCLDFAKIVDEGKQEGSPIPIPDTDEDQKQEEDQPKSRSPVLLFVAVTLG